MHLNEWSQSTLVNQDGVDMKRHFGKACKNLLISVRGVGVPGTIVNAYRFSDREDASINTNTDVMSNITGTIQMASNENAQSRNTGMTAMRQEMATLRAEVQANRQTLASNTRSAPPLAAPAPQWTPPMTPSPNDWSTQPALPIAAAYAAIPPCNSGGSPGISKLPRPSHRASAAAAPGQGRQRSQGTWATHQ